MGKPVSSAGRTTYAIAPLDSQGVEGDSGLSAYTFTVTRSGDTKKGGSVSYATEGAQVDDLGGSLSGKIIFSPGETSKIITVWVVGDSFVEADESFVVSLSDAVGGSISTASASGTIRNDDIAPPPPNPQLDISTRSEWFDADGDGFGEAGESIWHTYSISNVGNVPLSELELNDVGRGTVVSGAAAGDANANGLLDVGETWIFQLQQDLAQTNVDAGVIYSDATATATGPSGQLVSGAFQIDTAILQNPEVFLYKSGWWMDGSGAGIENLRADVGELIQFSFSIINLGSATLSNVALSDPMLEGTAITFLEGDADRDGLLDVGESWIYVGEYALTQVDVDAQILTNVASATAIAPTGSVISDQASCDVSLPWM